MTTEELEKKLKISKDTCIHCTTEELAKQVLNIFHQLGLKWCDEDHYIKHTNWDNRKENTVYYPFEGEFSSLNYARLIDYKIISAEEFIALHTKGEKFDLENYKPKGDLKDFPKEIIARMLECQEKQWNLRDISVFEKRVAAGDFNKGFTWHKTKEGNIFWSDVINNKDFDIFFERYPKQDNQNNSQEFRVDDLKNYEPKGDLKDFPKEIITRMLEIQEEQWDKIDVSVFEKDKTAGEGKKGIIWLDTREGYDFWNEVIRLKNFALFFARYPKKDNSQDFKINDKVYDILLKEVGVVQNIDYSSFLFYGLSVEFKSGLKSYTTNGYYIRECKNPQLLHYRDDYNYDVIDFNNLPKRQEPKRWRAEMDGSYYFVNFYIENWFISNETKDDYDPMDNGNYDSGNYFRTEVEAETMAQKLNTYFKQLIKEEQENLAKLKTN